MNIVLDLIAIGLIYLLVGIAVVNLYVTPWLKRLSPDTIRGILGDVGVPLDTDQELDIARRSYLVSIIPVWPIYAYRVATYGRHLS